MEITRVIFLTLDACHFKVIAKVTVKVLSALRLGFCNNMLKFCNDLSGRFTAFAFQSFPSSPKNSDRIIGKRKNEF